MRRRSPGPVALLGPTGLLGRALARSLRAKGREFAAVGRDSMDLARTESIASTLEALGPGAVINAAAFSDVARAELPESRREAFRVNRDAPGALGRACAELGVPLVHVSTDYVFDGSKRSPYEEGDATRPLQVYGLSKLEGEIAVLDACPGALVVRTSTLFGPGRPERPAYVDAILSQAAVRSRIRVVEPPVSSPTYSPDLAGGILALLESGAAGIVHLANSGSCSRLELARAAIEMAGLAETVEVVPWEAPEGDLRRPAYSVLATRRFASITGESPRPWRAALAEYLKKDKDAGTG